jgi:regulator of sigma E protease
MPFFNLLYALTALGGFCFLVGFHELGHFLACKLFGIHTPTFSIGFGPQLVSRKIGRTNFTLSAIPLGGYVEIAGNQEVGQGDQKEALSTESDSFAVRPYWQKALVMLGGIFFNLIFAYAAFVLIAAITIPQSRLFFPHNASLTIEKVEEGSPAAQAGLQKDDTLIALNQTPVSSYAACQEAIAASKEATIVTIKRGEELHTINVPAAAADAKDCSIAGAHPRLVATKGAGIVAAFPIAWQALTKGCSLISESMKQLFTKRSLNGMGGPLMMLSATSSSMQKGFLSFLLFLAFMSLNLALLNLLPLPILDGGQLLFVTIESLIRRKIHEKVKVGIYLSSWALILLFMLMVTMQDIRAISSRELLLWGVVGGVIAALSIVAARSK